MQVTKAVLCRITGSPIALVSVDKATRSIRVVGAYTTDGRPVNVVVMKVSSDKRKIARFNSVFPDVGASNYDAKTDTFYLM